MLIHHSNEDYQVAASEAAKQARAKMEALIEKGRSSALALVEHVNTKVPTDALVRGRALGWSTSNNGLGIEIESYADPIIVHPHALGQIAARANVPERYLTSLLQSENETLRALELAAAKDSFEGQDVLNLPPQRTLWRASNALSWIAGSTENADRRLELERLAGSVLVRERIAA